MVDSEFPSNGRRPDCISCRFLSSVVLLFAGGYVIYRSRNAKEKYSRIISYGFGSALGTVGVLRGLNVFPFDHGKQKNLKHS